MSTPIHTAILALLHEHDCVIVPQLGAFITRRLSSSYDERRGVMTPPSKIVAFNQDIQHSDGILADHIATVDKIDFSAAMRQVEDFASETKQRLNERQVVMLPSLGSLSVSENRVVFQPVPGLNVLTDSYGLEPVAARSARSAQIGKTIFTETRKVAASAVAVVALLCVSPRTADPDFVRADMATALTAVPAATPTGTAHTPTDVPEANIETHQAPKDKFCLVVASFLTRQEAKDYITSMRARGVDDLSILDFEGRCRVIAASFDNESQAQSAARDIRSLEGFEKAWVLRVE